MDCLVCCWCSCGFLSTTLWSLMEEAQTKEENEEEEEGEEEMVELVLCKQEES